VYVLFTETEDGGLKASMRSTAAVDVSRLAGQTYGGGGHARASGFRVPRFENFQLQVLECVQKLKEGMRAQSHDDDMKDIPPVAPAAPAPSAAPRAAETRPVPQVQKGIDLIEAVKPGDVPPAGTDVIKSVSTQG
jgi:hypothetical protein